MHGAYEFYNAIQAIFNDVSGCKDLNKTLLKKYWGNSLSTDLYKLDLSLTYTLKTEATEPSER